MQQIVALVVLVIKGCCFWFRLYRYFLFCVDWGACTNMKYGALMQFVLVCVPLFGGVYWGASLCS